jgi:hypothetical protein
MSAFAEPTCVYCGKGTTPKRLVCCLIRWRVRRLFYAHEACADRNVGRPVPRSRRNAKLQAPALADSLTAWNTLVDESEGLLARMRVTPHALATMDAACNAWSLKEGAR